MKHIWKKQLTATLLVLAMLVSLMPAALATEPEWTGGTDGHEHTAGTPVVTPATCTTNGSSAVTCTFEGCNATKTTVLTELGHDYTNGKAEKKEDDAINHKVTCAREGCVASKDEAHTFVFVSDSATQHHEKCSKCGFEKSPVEHSTTYKYETLNSAQHTVKCKDCEQSLRTENHDASTWNPGDSTKHWKICDNCKEKFAEAAHRDVSAPTGACDDCGTPVVTVTTIVNSTETVKTVKKGSDPGIADPSSSAGKFVGWSTSASDVEWDGEKTHTTTATVNSTVKAGISDSYKYYAVFDTRRVDDITVKVDAGESESFNEYDFEDAYDDHYNDTFKYVRFEKVSGKLNGKLYYDGSEISLNTLTSTSYYYAYSSSYPSNKLIEDLRLEADRIAEDSEMVFNYTAYGETNGHYVTGTFKLIVNGNADPDISYDVEPGKTVDFDSDDFDSFYDTMKAKKAGNLKYVTFDQKDSITTKVGSFQYDGKDITTSKVMNGKFYINASDASKSDYVLDKLTFVASKDFKTNVKILFTAVGDKSGYNEVGLLEIRSTKNAEGDILYKVAANSYVDFNEDDFNDYYQTEKNTSKDIKYVIFNNLPATSAGTMYVNYGTKSEEKMTSSKFVGTKFYYGDNGGKNDYDLDDLTFETSKTFKTAVRINFTAYESNSKKAEGTLVIDPNGASYVSDIRYTTTTDTKVQINANDIARFFNKTYPYYDLQYVTFTGVPDVGSLYYNYYGVSKYGSTTAMQLTKNNCSSKLFYFSPSTTANYALSELTYVPSGTNYCTTIPFIAYSGNRPISGSILISVSTKAVSEVYTVTQKGTAVTFPASAVVNAVKTATGSTLASIQLLSTPAASVASVSVGSTAANTSTAYVSGSTMNQLKITPALGYTGSIELPYVALNSNGTAIASGVVSVGVVNALKSFSDVAATGWYYKYVTELADAGVINGYPNGSYKPNNTVTYGEALKLIMRAAGYSEQKATGKHFASGYLAKAQADGIVTSTSVDLNKAITRQQVAELAARAMKLSTSNLSTSRPFTDTTNVYVQALNAAGIVEGYFANGTSTFKPNNTLTRAEAATIVWRMQNNK